MGLPVASPSRRPVHVLRSSGASKVTQRNESLKRLLRKRLPWAGRLAVALAVLEIGLDYSTWVELNVATIYSLPLVLAAAARNRRLLWVLTFALACASFVVYFQQVHPGSFSWSEIFFVERLLSTTTVILTAVLLDAWTRLLDILDEQSRSLAEQNERLVTANDELRAHKEEIQRQNELLDRRRQEAEDASSRKSRLLASASHDIRTPLHAINLMADVIRRSATNPEIAVRVPSMAQRLQANALSLSGLLDEILDASSFDSGKIELRESEFSVERLLSEGYERFLPIAESKGLRLEIEFPHAPLQLHTDRPKLGRIVDNLLTNAIKFTDAGSVTLAARHTPQGEGLIQVRDTGVGMDSKDHDRAFGEGASAQRSGRDDDQGWGLGLPICERLAKMLGGTIETESEPSRGTVFTVCLPSSCVASRTVVSEDQ